MSTTTETPDLGALVQTPSSIGITANAHVAMEQQSTVSASTPFPLAIDSTRDIVMADGTPDRPDSPAILLGATSAASPAPQRLGTPSRASNGNEGTSRAASMHPESAPTFPKEARPHGAPTRQYFNGKVTTVLLEGMKQLARDQPKDPLRVLGEYLLQRSKEIEGH